MNPLVPLILAFAIIGLAIGSVINFGFAFLALPFLLVFGWLAVGADAFARTGKIQQMKRFRREARARKVEFDDEDRKTISV
jgi:hypothetical protein